MSLKKPIVALIYDFDGTLSPANMQEYGLIQALGNTVDRFWGVSNGLGADKSMCSVLAYMKVMVDEAARMGIPLTRSFLEQFGPQIELFKGVTEWFRLINSYGASKGVKVEHYVISSGLTELIESTTIAREFKKVFACSFLYDADGIARWPAVAVDYTAKTQFLFKISKGIMDISDKKIEVYQMKRKQMEAGMTEKTVTRRLTMHEIVQLQEKIENAKKKITQE